jgi:hypothetical protein
VSPIARAGLCGKGRLGGGGADKGLDDAGGSALPEASEARDGGASSNSQSKLSEHFVNIQ